MSEVDGLTDIRQLTGSLLAQAGDIHLDASMSLDFDADPAEAMADVVGFWEAIVNAADLLEIDVPDTLQEQTLGTLESLGYALESQDVELICALLRNDLLERVEEWKTLLSAVVVIPEPSALTDPLDADSGVDQPGLDE